MTVEELIAVLQSFPREATVYTRKPGEIQKVTIQTTTPDGAGGQVSIYPQLVWLERG